MLFELIMNIKYIPTILLIFFALCGHYSVADSRISKWPAQVCFDNETDKSRRAQKPSATPRPCMVLQWENITNN
jgi:hypothetical protein